MLTAELIRRKRDGGELSSEEIGRQVELFVAAAQRARRAGSPASQGITSSVAA